MGTSQAGRHVGLTHRSVHGFRFSGCLDNGGGGMGTPQPRRPPAPLGYYDGRGSGSRRCSAGAATARRQLVGCPVAPRPDLPAEWLALTLAHGPRPPHQLARLAAPGVHVPWRRLFLPGGRCGLGQAGASGGRFLACIKNVDFTLQDLSVFTRSHRFTF